MSNAFTKTMSNIPKTARFMLGISAVVTVAAGAILSGSLSGNKNSENTSTGNSSISSAPTNSQIGKTKPGEKSIIPDGSPLQKQIDFEKNKEINEKKVDGGGYMEQLSFNKKPDDFIDKIQKSNNQDLLEKSIEKINDAKKGTQIDGYLQQSNSRRYIEEKHRKLAEAQKSRAIKNMQSEQMKNDFQYHTEILEIQTKEDKDFINNEIQNANSENIYSSYFSQKPYKQNREMSAYLSFDKRNNNLNKNSKYSPNQKKSNDIFDNYVRKPEDMPTMDVDALNRYRRSSSGISENKMTAYEQLAHPMDSERVNREETVNTGELYYSVLQIGVNTDEIGPVRAIIPSEGKLKDAVLVGSPVRNGQKISIVFNKMSLDGKEYSVNVIALDPDTLRPALADNVDNHTFERYAKLAVAAAAEGYVEALTGITTKTRSDGSTEEIRDRLPKTRDQVAQAIGKVGQVLIPKYEHDFDIPPSVELNSNKDIVLMFMGPVKISVK